jgi:hypothetical protein
MKAGTTSLASALGAHGDVFACPIKEPNHFSGELHEAGMSSRNPTTKSFDISRYLGADTLEPRHHAYVERLEDYEALFRDCRGEAYRLDASTTYFNSPVAAEAIHRYNPDARIIVALRDPVARGWSEFLMNMRIGSTNSDPLAALEREAQNILHDRPVLFERYVSTGFYDYHLAKFACFPADQVLVVQAEDLRNDWAGEMAKVWRFLGLAPEPGASQPVSENVGGAMRFPALNHFAHRTGLKYLLRDLFPPGIASKAKSLLVSETGDRRQRERFFAAFPEYRDKVAHKFRLSGT